MRTFCLLVGLLCCCSLPAQDLQQKLSRAMAALESDAQFSHGIIGLCVADSETGKILFEKNAGIGLAPASCQKVITSVSAFELLGHDYQYKTLIGFDAPAVNAVQKGNLLLSGYGDPTLGSWRWKTTKEQIVLGKILALLKARKVTAIADGVYINDLNFSYQPVPDGWIWQDIGNYYGAGAWGLNWRENQFDLNLRSGNAVGERTTVIATVPPEIKSSITNLISTGKKGSGDNGYIYSSPYNERIFTTGTIPAGESRFTIAGSLPNPPAQFAREIEQLLKANNISYEQGYKTFANNTGSKEKMPVLFEALDSILSPPLDSINYWFLKKSVNLFGEALVKTISYERNGIGSTDDGIAVIRDLWDRKGIERSSLKIIDGSGLSPANRVTTSALVHIMLYAAKQPWFASFYHALPETNGIKMKDGYIGGVRSYTGFVRSANGRSYTFSFIVNNFDGNPSTVREKMWKVLDLLK